MTDVNEANTHLFNHKLLLSNSSVSVSRNVYMPLKVAGRSGYVGSY